MSLFERIQNKRYDLQEGKKFGPGSDGRVNFNGDNTKKDKKEPLSDKEKLYRSRRNVKAKELGYKSGSELEKTVDRGLKSIDKKPGGKLPKTGYATGEPFQPDNNPATVKYVKNKEGTNLRKVPGTGKFPASGKSTLQGRFRYPSMDKDFSKAVKSGEVERDVAKRLKTRLSFTAKDELGDIRTPQGKKNIDTFVGKVFKNQKGTIGTGKGKDSDLYKILKRDIDNRNPTVPSKSKVINPKTGTRFRKPMSGGFDSEGGRTGTKAQQNRYDMTAQRKAAKFDKEIVKQAKLPKDLKIPKGGSGDSTPLAKKELNVKYKAAKMKLDYGGRMAKKDPKIAKMTTAQKKANFEKIKAAIDKKNPTFKSPASGGKLPMTKVQAFKDSASKTLKKTRPILRKAVKFGIRHPGRTLAGAALGSIAVNAGIKTLMNKKKGQEPISNKNTRSLGPTLKKDGTPVEYQYSLSGNTLGDKRIKNVSRTDLSKGLKSGKYKTTRT